MSLSRGGEDATELRRLNSTALSQTLRRTRSQTFNNNNDSSSDSFTDVLLERQPSQQQFQITDILVAAESDDAGSSDEDLNRYPFSYFLTPLDDEGADDERVRDVHLSAGIEDDTQLERSVQIVSPSSISRPGSPPSLCSSAMTSDASDSDEDYEDYENYENSQSHSLGLPVSLQDLTTAFEKRQIRHDTATISALSSGLKARGVLKNTPRGRSRSLYRYRARRHSWREPSPSVWSIAEEDESGDRPLFERKKSTKKVRFELGG